MNVFSVAEDMMTEDHQINWDDERSIMKNYDNNKLIDRNFLVFILHQHRQKFSSISLYEGYFLSVVLRRVHHVISICSSVCSSVCLFDPCPFLLIY